MAEVASSSILWARYTRLLPAAVRGDFPVRFFPRERRRHRGFRRRCEGGREKYHRAATADCKVEQESGGNGFLVICTLREAPIDLGGVNEPALWPVWAFTPPAKRLAPATSTDVFANGVEEPLVHATTFKRAHLASCLLQNHRPGHTAEVWTQRIHGLEDFAAGRR